MTGPIPIGRSTALPATLDELKKGVSKGLDPRTGLVQKAARQAVVAGATNTKRIILGTAWLTTQAIGQAAATAQSAYSFVSSGPDVYRFYAKQYATVFGSLCEEVHMATNVFLKGQGSLTNAHLSGEMLRMYLDQKEDADLIRRVGNAITISNHYKEITEFVEWKLRAYAVELKRLPVVSELKPAAQSALTLLIRPKRKGVRPYYFGREGLQPIIGGIVRLNTSWAEVKNQKPAKGKDPAILEYELQVQIGDIYDFDNERVGRYEAFRTKIKVLLCAGKFHELEYEYTDALRRAPLTSDPNDNDPLDKGHIFASYMYALEQAGYFKGMSWDVLLPMKGTLAYPSPPPTPPAWMR